MSDYHVVCLDKQSRVMYMDSQSATKWVVAGWQVRKYNSHHEAQLAVEEWEVRNGKPKLFLVRRPADMSLIP